LSTTPLEEPEGNWWDIPVGGYEKLWLGITIVWAVMLFGWMAGWAYMGNQNPTGKTYRISAEDYKEKVNDYRDRAEETEDGFLKPPGEDVYVASRRYAWFGLPVELKAGKRYKFHLGSYDVQHGFSVRKEDVLSKQSSLQILPGYEWVLPMRFDEPGTYHVVCNEFCGYGHRTMHAKFRVVE
jgi:cytochrome c oxidase subunit 2